MNIFRRELKAHWKGLLGWSIAMILLVVSGMAKFSALGSGGQSANQIFQAFPKPVLVILGIQGLDLTRVIGYFGVLYLYIQLAASIHAAMLGAEIISKEERDRTSEFLYPKPVTRMHVVTEKVLAGLVNIIIINIITLVSSIIMVAAFANNFLNNDMIIMLMAGLFIMQLVFFTLGVALAGYFKNPRLPSVVSTTVLLGTYIIWVVIDLNANLDFLKFVTPFKYFDASVLISNGYLDPFYVVLSLLIVTIMMASAYLTFNKRDLKV
jgi:ABC-2 type transport system permease protein